MLKQKETNSFQVQDRSSHKVAFLKLSLDLEKKIKTGIYSLCYDHSFSICFWFPYYLKRVHYMIVFSMKKVNRFRKQICYYFSNKEH